MHPRPLTRAALAATAALGLAACTAPASDPTPSASAEPTAVASAEPVAFAGDPAAFAVVSDDVAADGQLSNANLGRTSATCNGDGKSLHLEWNEPPAGTESFAVIFENVTHDVVYWARYNIEPQETGFEHGHYGATSGTEANSDFGLRYPVAPCPDDADVDEYLLTVWALDSELPDDLHRHEDVREAIAGHELAEATLSSHASGIE